MRKLFGLLLILCSTTTFANLSPTEVQIRANADASFSAQVNFLKKITLINSGTNDISGVEKVAAIVRPEFEALGFKTQMVAEPASFNRAPTLIAEHPGTGKRILLISHLDTVFPADSPFKGFTVSGDSAHGPGADDDKGGVAIILYSLKALQAAHQLDKANITVVLTGDEEDSGKPAAISRKPLIAAAKNSDVALDFEEGAMDYASIARRGISQWTVTAQGVEGHSSLIFKDQYGDGAIFEVARILNSMRTEMSSMKDITYNPSLIVGGTNTAYDSTDNRGKAFGKNNVIAKTATVTGDFRYLTPQQRDAIKQKMREIVAQHLPNTNATIQFVDGIPSMPPTKANYALLEKYSQVSEDLGQPKIHALDANQRGAGDISYVAGIVPANLVGLGPMGSDTHSDKETVQLSSLKIQTERAALLIHRLSSQ